MSSAPDLPAVVTAWRRWRVLDQGAGPRLMSLVSAAQWPGRAEMIARCVRGDHQVPGERCGCGLYAVADLTGAAEVGLRGEVVGCVALWGGVVQGVLGSRASYGYPLVLFAEPTIDEHARRRLAEHYGVAVHAAPAEFAALARVGGARLSMLGDILRQRAGALGRPIGAELTTERASIELAATELLEEMRRVAPQARAYAALRARCIRRRKTLHAVLCLWLVPAVGAAVAGAVLSRSQTNNVSSAWASMSTWPGLIATLVVASVVSASVWAGFAIARKHVFDRCVGSHRADLPWTFIAATLAVLVILPPVGLLGRMFTGDPRWEWALAGVPLGLAWLGLTRELLWLVAVIAVPIMTTMAWAKVGDWAWLVIGVLTSLCTALRSWLNPRDELDLVAESREFGE